MQPLSVLHHKASLSPMSLLATTIFAPLILRERVYRTHMQAMLFISMGCIVVVNYKPHENQMTEDSRDHVPWERILFLLSRALFLVLLFGVIIPVIMALLSLPLRTPFRFCCLSAMCGACSAACTKLSVVFLRVLYMKTVDTISTDNSGSFFTMETARLYCHSTGLQRLPF